MSDNCPALYGCTGCQLSTPTTVRYSSHFTLLSLRIFSDEKFPCVMSVGSWQAHRRRSKAKTRLHRHKVRRLHGIVRTLFANCPNVLQYREIQLVFHLLSLRIFSDVNFPCGMRVGSWQAHRRVSKAKARLPWHKVRRLHGTMLVVQRQRVHPEDLHCRRPRQGCRGGALC